MDVIDNTGSAFLYFTGTDRIGRNFDVLVVKESYALDDDLRLVRRPEPDLITFADQYFGEPNTSSLLCASDVVPYKPTADILVAAETWAPGNRPAASWPFGVTVTGDEHREIRMQAFSPRKWEPALLGWRLTEPKPVKSVPVRYERAFGGQIEVDSSPPKTEVLETNPIGSGWIDRKRSDPRQAVAAPQILFADDRLEDPYRKLEPASLGAMPPAWMPRRALAGTYDDDWTRDTAPNWASDFDYAFHNSAAPALQLDGYLSGRETLEFTNLRPERGRFSLHLPATGILLRAQKANGHQVLVKLNADTFFADLTPAWTGACLVTVSWRLVMAPGTFAQGWLERLPLDDPAWDHADPAPHPDDLEYAEKFRESA